MQLFRRLTHIPERREALLAITASSILWGISAPIMKILLSIAPIFLVAFLRFFIASLLVLFLKPSLRLEKTDIPRIIIASIINISLHIPLFLLGLKLTGVINATMFAAMGPLLTLLFAKEFLNENVRRNMTIGCVVGFAGFFIIMLNPLLTEGLSLSLLGNFFLFLSTLTWIFYELLTKKLHKKYDTKTITFYTFFIGSLPLLPFAAMSFHLLPNLITMPVFVFAILWGIIITSFLAFFIWRWGFERLELSRIGFFAYIDPVIATVVAVIFLGEVVTAQFIGGAFFIFLGLYIAEATIHLPHFHLYRVHSSRKK